MVYCVNALLYVYDALYVCVLYVRIVCSVAFVYTVRMYMYVCIMCVYCMCVVLVDMCVHECVSGPELSQWDLGLAECLLAV